MRICCNGALDPARRDLRIPAHPKRHKYGLNAMCDGDFGAFSRPRARPLACATGGDYDGSTASLPPSQLIP